MWEEFEEKLLGGKVCKTTFIWSLNLQKYKTLENELDRAEKNKKGKREDKKEKIK